MADFVRGWTNEINRLWRYDSDQTREYMARAAVDKINRHYRDPLDDPEWRDYTVFIYATLADNEFLMDLSGKESFEVLTGLCVDPSYYNPDHVSMRFTDCRPIQSWIDAPVIFHPGQVSQMMVYAEIACRVEFFLKGQWE